MPDQKTTFSTDKQTKDDLQILGKYSTSSLYSLFQKTKTKGAAQLLEDYFQQPLSDRIAIEERQQKIKSVMGYAVEFPVEQADFAAFELFIRSFSAAAPIPLFIQSSKRRVQALIGIREELDHAQKLMEVCVDVLYKIKRWFTEVLKNVPSTYIQDLCGRFDVLWQNTLLDAYHGKMTRSARFWYRIERFLRSEHYDRLTLLIQVCHELDLIVAVASVAEQRHFSFPDLDQSAGVVLQLEEAYHPMIPKAIGNTLDLNDTSNLLFLTGANMAGKSTWMKTISVCFYLAHMGFPVPAKSMRISVFDGIYTSINLPDDMQKGYSHFYAEVIRVKDIAKEVASGKRLLVVFDELFKGTNVKDAYDATLEITKSLASYERCLFVISTHIVEVGEALTKEAKPIQFRFMPTVMEGNQARYPYVLENGISDDRHGMMIIKQEGILALFDTIKTDGKQ